MTEAERIDSVENIQTLYDLAIYNYLQFGTYKMLIYEDGQEVREYTNVEVAREATSLAVGLQKLGIQKGDRVMVMMLNCPEVIISYQAIARAGAIIIPILPLLKSPEVRYIAENSQAKAVITNAILLPLLQSALTGVSMMQQIIATGDVGPLNSSSSGGIGQKESYAVHAYRDIVASGSSQADSYLSDLEGISITPDDAAASRAPARGAPTMDEAVASRAPARGAPTMDEAVTLYTSGTTGHPKGVVLTHRNLVSNAVSGWGTEMAASRRGEVQLAILPLAHSYGMLISNVSYLSGVTLVMHPRFDTTAVLSAIERYHAIGFAGVPAMFVALLYSPEANNYDTSSLQQCVSGSAPLPVAVLEGFEQKFGCRILEGYGLTEASTAVTAHSIDIEQKPGSVGKPLSNVEVRVVDENDSPVPVGMVGEVVVRGPNVMKGYYKMPEETESTLRNGWLHTGDMGRFDEDGYLYIVERKKDLIIRGGLNVYPRDVEEVLNRHPAVIESAVIGVPSIRMGEEVKAFVVTRVPVNAEALKAYCRESLANYKTPSEIEFVKALPRNLIGKIDKKVLRLWRETSHDM